MAATTTISPSASARAETAAPATATILSWQFTRISGRGQRQRAGGSGVCRDSRAPAPGGAPCAVHKELLLYQAQNERRMAFAASTCVMAQLRRLLRVDPNDRGTEQSLAWWRIGLPETGALRAHDTTRAELVTWRSQQKVGM